MGRTKSWAGSGKELAKLLEPLVKDRTRVFLKFSEVIKCELAKGSDQEIKDAHWLLELVHKCQENLSIKRTAWAECLGILAARFAEQKGWKLKGEDVPSYVHAMTNRCMNLCHVVAQGQIRHANVGWAKELPWRSAIAQQSRERLASSFSAGSSPVGAAPTEAADVAAPAGNGDLVEATRVDPLQYKCDWSSEMNQAFRIHVKDRKKKREFSIVVEAPDNGKVADSPDDPIAAVWRDGMTWVVIGMTRKDLDKAKASRKSSTRAAHWFSGTMPGTNNSLIVKTRIDAEPSPVLISLQEQGRQILQAAVRYYPTESQAAEMIVGIAKSYMAGIIQKEGLSAERDRQFNIAYGACEVLPPRAKRVLHVMAARGGF